MEILVACEESQIVTEAFIKQGHKAMSCDLNYPGAKGLPHYQGDVRDLLGQYFDMVIFHPVCRYISNSGIRWLHTEPLRWKKMFEACDFFNLRHQFNSPMVATENPRPHPYAVKLIGESSQNFQPWHHGHKKMKETHLWLKGLPELNHSNIVGPPPKDKKERNKWQDTWMASPGPDRERLRSVTYEGIANAMADQWGGLEKLSSEQNDERSVATDAAQRTERW